MIWRAMSSRVICFVDGLNFSHSVRNLDETSLYDVNLSLLAQHLLKKNEQLEKVYYFSALQHSPPKEKAEHEAYIEKLEASGVKVILGKFKKEKRKCESCGHKSRVYREKETDVNIAVQMTHHAASNTFDRAFLMSNDSDFVPAINIVTESYPPKKVTLITLEAVPPSKALLEAATDKRTITQDILIASLFKKTLKSVAE